MVDEIVPYEKFEDEKFENFGTKLEAIPAPWPQSTTIESTIWPIVPESGWAENFGEKIQNEIQAEKYDNRELDTARDTNQYIDIANINIEIMIALY